MASQSPDEKEAYEEYENGWYALTGLMDSGSSWSGSERNNAYLALDDGTYVDVSALAGLDFLDDGRAVVTTDWNGDGAVDLWFKNRTGPQLRFLENRIGVENGHVTLQLEGRTCNRDAIGAVVELRVGERVLVKTVMGGEGYLSQSSTRLVFGLGTATKINSARVRWPGGDEQVLGGLEVGGRYRVVQGEDPGRVKREPTVYVDEAVTDTHASSAARVVLRTPLPLPPTMARGALGVRAAGRARAISLWAHWCAPCVDELRGFAGASAELHAAGVDVFAFNVDVAEDHAAAAHIWKTAIEPSMGEHGFAALSDEGLAARLEVLLDHIFVRRGEGVLPTTLLIDKNNMVQVVYLGGITPEVLAADVADYGLQPEKPRDRTSFPGRWFFGVLREFGELSTAMGRRGFAPEKSFYATLKRLQERSQR